MHSSVQMEIVQLFTHFYNLLWFTTTKLRSFISPMISKEHAHRFVFLFDSAVMMINYIYSHVLEGLFFVVLCANKAFIALAFDLNESQKRICRGTNTTMTDHYCIRTNNRTWWNVHHAKNDLYGTAKPPNCAPAIACNSWSSVSQCLLCAHLIVFFCLISWCCFSHRISFLLNQIQSFDGCSRYKYANRNMRMAKPSFVVQFRWLIGITLRTCSLNNYYLTSRHRSPFARKNWLNNTQPSTTPFTIF